MTAPLYILCTLANSRTTTLYRSVLLIALDSVGIDPLGHDRRGSIYGDSAFLFPRGKRGPVIPVVRETPRGACGGVLVETDVTGGGHRGAEARGAIECAITYTSLFSGHDTIARHGLMQGLGMNDALLESLVREGNLFARFRSVCLANAMFPLHFPFFQGSYVQGYLPHVAKPEAEARIRFRGRPLRLLGLDKWGFAELFTACEINQNIFVYAAQQAGVRLRDWNDVRRGEALTSSLTNELENDFDLSACGIEPLPPRTPDEAAEILARLADAHEFVFYKYQLADLISHTGREDLARETFRTIERFIGAVLDRVDTGRTTVCVTCDHGHLEQVGFSHGHPKSRVPTWYFAPNVTDSLRESAGPQSGPPPADRTPLRDLTALLQRPEGICRVLSSPLDPSRGMSMCTRNDDSPAISRRQWLAATAATGMGAGAATAVADTAGSVAHALRAPGFAVRYCLNTSTISGQKLSLPDQIDVAAKAGYDAIEPWIRDIDQFVNSGGKTADLRQRLADANLTVESAIGFAQWIVDDEAQRQAGLEQLKRDMDLVRELGGTRIAAPPVGAHQKEAPQIDLFRIAERYRAALEVGDQTGVVPQAEVWGFSKNLSRLGETIFVCVESGHPKACLLPDIYHIHRGGSAFTGLKLLSAEAFRVFHVNDYPTSKPRTELNDADRVYPGDGNAPLATIIESLRAIGFRGALSLELFNRDYWKQDALEVAKTGLAKMRAMVGQDG